MYVSITGLKLDHWWYMPLFWRHSFGTMIDARKATGNILSDARRVDSVLHTLSGWKTREDMLVYLRSTRHVQAMRRFSGIATGKVYGFDTEVMPSWKDALQLYHDHGREVYVRN